MKKALLAFWKESSIISLTFEAFFCCLNKQDCHLFLKDFKIVKVLNFIRNADGCFIIGHEFIKPNNLYSIPCESSALDIYSVRNLSQLKRGPLNSFLCKALLLPMGDKKQSAVFPIQLQSHFKQ